MIIWLAASHSKIGEPWPSTLTVFHSTGDKSQKFPLGIGGNQKKQETELYEEFILEPSPNQMTIRLLCRDSKR